jgi:hypothetical protein
VVRIVSESVSMEQIRALVSSLVSRGLDAKIFENAV